MRLFDSLEKIDLVKPGEYFNLIESRKNKGNKAKIFRNNKKVKQLDLYCFLKLNFGEPNGFFSLLRGDHSNNFIEWHYSLKIDDIYTLDIMGSKRFLEFHVSSINNNVALDNFNEIDFFASLNNQIFLNRKEIYKKKNQLEYWVIFLNTYKRLKDTIEEFYQKYQKLALQDPEPLQTESPLVTKLEIDRYQSQTKNLIKNILTKKSYGIVLRMLFPVLGESLVNLIIFILAKDEIKNDKRLLDNMFRSQIDIRIKTLYLNCNKIEKAYDQNDERFKNFLKLMNKRNDFLHGNILPAINTFDEVYFDGKIPFFEEEKDIVMEYVKQNLFQVTEKEVNQDYQTIEQFKNYILDNISLPSRDEIKLILNKGDLGWNKKTKRIGILFDNELLQAFMIKGDGQ